MNHVRPVTNCLQTGGLANLGACVSIRTLTTFLSPRKNLKQSKERIMNIAAVDVENVEDL